MTIANQSPGKQRCVAHLVFTTGCFNCEEVRRKAESATFTAAAGETALALAINTADLLTDAERVELFSRYCRECGTKDLPCHCWNDE